MFLIFIHHTVRHLSRKHKSRRRQDLTIAMKKMRFDVIRLLFLWSEFIHRHSRSQLLPIQYSSPSPD